MQTKCGECKIILQAGSTRAMIDAIQLHCREYHPAFGNDGEVFVKLNSDPFNDYLNAQESDEL